MMRIRLAGDHPSYHCGSAAVMQTIAAELRRHGEIVTGDEYDVLVVNGEGSMHHGGGAFVEKMRLIEAAAAAGRPAHLINSVWQDNPTGSRRKRRGDLRFDGIACRRGRVDWKRSWCRPP